MYGLEGQPSPHHEPQAPPLGREQAPEELLAALTPFLGPYRETAAHDDGQLARA
jgi:hypothetical protein